MTTKGQLMTALAAAHAEGIANAVAKGAEAGATPHPRTVEIMTWESVVDRALVEVNGLIGDHHVQIVEFADDHGHRSLMVIGTADETVALDPAPDMDEGAVAP